MKRFLPHSSCTCEKSAAVTVDSLCLTLALGNSKIFEPLRAAVTACAT